MNRNPRKISGLLKVIAINLRSQTTEYNSRSEYIEFVADFTASALDVLKTIEWSGKNGTCPYCCARNWNPDGTGMLPIHLVNCKLNNLLNNDEWVE